MSIGGRALIGLGAPNGLPNSVKLRMPNTYSWESDVSDKIRSQRETAQTTS